MLFDKRQPHSATGGEGPMIQMSRRICPDNNSPMRRIMSILRSQVARHDDSDRTSPHGRGLRSIVLSTALEFNPLKASIGFLALIIGPALLVGIAPSIVVTYGRLTFRQRLCRKHQSSLSSRWPC
jgi:hypothetical protein